MGVYIGSNNMKELFIGSTRIRRVYLGAELLYKYTLPVIYNVDTNI